MVHVIHGVCLKKKGTSKKYEPAYICYSTAQNLEYICVFHNRCWTLTDAENRSKIAPTILAIQIRPFCSRLLIF